MGFRIGESYPARLNGELTSFRVLDIEGNECFIRWSDGDMEWVYILDMKRWLLGSWCDDDDD